MNIFEFSTLINFFLFVVFLSSAFGSLPRYQILKSSKERAEKIVNMITDKLDAVTVMKLEGFEVSDWSMEDKMTIALLFTNTKDRTQHYSITVNQNRIWIEDGHHQLVKDNITIHQYIQITLLLKRRLDPNAVGDEEYVENVNKFAKKVVSEPIEDLLALLRVSNCRIFDWHSAGFQFYHPTFASLFDVSVNGDDKLVCRVQVNEIQQPTIVREVKTINTKQKRDFLLKSLIIALTTKIENHLPELYHDRWTMKQLEDGFYDLNGEEEDEDENEEPEPEPTPALSTRIGKRQEFAHMVEEVLEIFGYTDVAFQVPEKEPNQKVADKFHIYFSNAEQNQHYLLSLDHVNQYWVELELDDDEEDRTFNQVLLQLSLASIPAVMLDHEIGMEILGSLLTRSEYRATQKQSFSWKFLNDYVKQIF